MMVTMNGRKGNCLALKPPISLSRQDIILFNRAARAARQPMGKRQLVGPEINPLVVSLQCFWGSCGAFNPDKTVLFV